MMKDDDFKLLRGFASEQTNRRTDICECRVAFATEKEYFPSQMHQSGKIEPNIFHSKRTKYYLPRNGQNIFEPIQTKYFQTELKQ